MCVKQLFLKTKKQKKNKKKQKRFKETRQHAKNIIGTNKRHNGKEKRKERRECRIGDWISTAPWAIMNDVVVGFSKM
jgi:hypothetical protein